MAAGAFLNVCRFQAVSSGTGDFVVSSAVTGFQTPASAGAVNATVYSYRAESTDLTEWEIGEGAYTTATTTQARTTVHASSNAGAAVNFTSAPQVGIVALTGDLYVRGNSAATESFAGVAELTTNAEARTGTDTARTITAANHVASHRPAFDATGTSTSLTTDAWGKLTIGTEVFDSDANYDPTTNYRFTPNVAGYYFFHAYGSATTDGGAVGLAIYKNGSEIASQKYDLSNTSTNFMSVSTMIQMNGSTDYVEVYGFSSHATAAATCNRFGGFRLFPTS